MTAAVNDTTSGFTSWGSTQWYVGTSAPGTWNCNLAPATTISGGLFGSTNTVTFTITAPAAPGIYNAYFRAQGSTDCSSSNQSATYTLANSVIVPAAPTVTTNAATGLSATGATLNATVSSNGASTTVSFDYGTSSGSYTNTTTGTVLAANASGTAVSIAVTGLTCNTKYFYRAKGVNGVGTTNGAETSLTTSACIPATVTTTAATSVTATGATLNGTVTSNGAVTTATFEYGLNTAYGSTATATQSPLAADASGTVVSVAVTGLTCNTQYHFRADGSNVAGTANGGDLTFTTSACAPTVTTNAASGLSRTGATLNATVSSNGASTTVSFDYGTSSGSYTNTTTGTVLAANASGTAVPIAVTGLTCNTKYFYRAKGGNSAGTTNGAETSLTTSACIPATVTTTAATSVTATGATLNGTVTSNGAVTTATFEYGLNTAYGSTATAAQSPLAANASGTVVSAAVTGLTCNTQYHFRADAANVAGTANGGDLTFTTLACPPTVTTNAASGLSTTGATLNGTVSSNGGSTTVLFEYGPDAGYGSTVAATQSPLVATASNAAVSATLSSLGCGTLYHYRVDATNGGGMAYGNDVSFTTSPCPVVLGKTSGTSSGSVNSYVTFTVTATNPNASTALTNVVVTDALPAGMSYSSAAASLGLISVSGAAPQTLTWTIAYLPPNTSAALTLVVQLTQQGTLTNTVSSPGAASASAYIVALPGGIVHYRMDEAAGSWNGALNEVKDDGSQGLHGTRVTVTSSTTTTTNAVSPNPVITSANPSLPVVGGGFCNAGKFDGNAVIRTPNNSFFQFKNVLSASAWIYPTSYPPKTGSGSGYDPNSDLYSILSNDVNYEFHINSAGKLYWWWQIQTGATCTSAGNAYILNSAQTIPLNKWTHVAITFDSGATNHRQRIYINGQLDTETTANATGTLVTNLCPMYVGGDITTDQASYNACKTPACTLIPERTFVGMIDEPKIYAYELSANEVQADMTLGRLCSGIYDHIRIEYSGSASVCKSKTVTVKACMDSGCTSLYPGTVTLKLTPTGWTPSDTVTISGGMTTATLSNTAISGTSLTLGGTAISPAPNNSTVRCFNGSTETCTVAVDSSPCSPIDAVEKGASAKTDLYTKLAGTAFNVDLLALLNSTSSTIDPNYVGTVSYDIVDASTTACPNGTALTAAQSASFAATDLGRKNVTMSPVATAASRAQVRIKLGATSSYACSSDQFAIRPSWVTLATTQAPPATPPNPSDAATIKAGNAFTLRGTATSGYSGTLTLNAAKLSAQDPNQNVAVAGGAVGTLTTTPASDATSTTKLDANDITTANNATYNEVGYVYLAPGAYVDSSFTAIDRAAGDCITDTTSDNNLSTTLVGSPGKYGCDIGTTAVSLGRFIPDHLGTAVTPVMACPAGLTACPPGGMLYSGQPITTAIAAYAAGGTKTLNYTGYFARAVRLSAWDAPGSIASNRTAAPGALVVTTDATNTNTVVASNFISGATSLSPATTPTLTYTFTSAAPTAPTNIFIRADEPAGADGVSSLRTANPTTTSVEGGVAVVNGRLKLSNAFGSEKSNLSMALQAQYWGGNSWVLSSTDTTTGPKLKAPGTAATVVALSSYTSQGTPALASTNLGTSHILDIADGSSAGTWKLTLTAPDLVGGKAPTGSVGVAINLGSGAADQSCLGAHPATAGLALPWLRSIYGTCATSAAGSADPSARATFGIYSPETTKTIHVRELY
ncbi:MAG: hypothetical protein PHY45_07645 [Rhodocyclaceae bacterium]|nr:hypothetical protein [Rhodocyclaceae bacterium]